MPKRKKKVAPISEGHAVSDDRLGPDRRSHYKPELAIPSSKPVAEIVALLAEGETAPGADELRSLIEEALHQLRDDQRVSAAHENLLMINGTAEEKVFKAVESLQAALRGIRALGTIVIPVWIEESLEPDLVKLGEWSQPTEWWKRNRPGRGHKKSGSARNLPVPVLRAHQIAHEMLGICGIKASMGSTDEGGGKLTLLGSMLCAAAGIQLPVGESTKAAELAGSEGGAKLMARESGRLWPFEPLPPD